MVMYSNVGVLNLVVETSKGLIELIQSRSGEFNDILTALCRYRRRKYSCCMFVAVLSMLAIIKRRVYADYSDEEVLTPLRMITPSVRLIISRTLFRSHM